MKKNMNFFLSWASRQPRNMVLSVLMLCCGAAAHAPRSAAANVHSTHIAQVMDVPQNDAGLDADTIVNAQKISPTNTYGEFLRVAEKYTPALIAILANMEGFSAKPYLIAGKWTQGYGSTTTKTGARVTKKTKAVTKEEAFITAARHIEIGETYLVMYAIMCEYNRALTPGEFLGLASFVYNGGPALIENQDVNMSSRWWALRQLLKANGENLSRDQVTETFKKYPVTSPGRVIGAFANKKIASENLGDEMGRFVYANHKKQDGLVWRRWLEASLIRGTVSVDDLVHLPVGGGWAFRQFAMSHGHDLVEDGKINYAAADMFHDWIKSPSLYDKNTGKYVQLADLQSVEEILPDFAMAQIEQTSDKTIAFDVASRAVRNKSDKNMQRIAHDSIDKGNANV